MTSFWGHQDNPFPLDEPDYPCCPICGQKCETIYKIDNEIVGCDQCMTTRNAWEVTECFGE
jgi:hypothetical protein